MDTNAIKDFVEKTWDESVIPQLMEYIRIPALSPGFDKNWEEAGLLLKAAKLIEKWCHSMELKNCHIRTISPENRTPLVLVEVDAFLAEMSDSILFYGHIDKQPEFTGWDEGKGPWKPVLEDDKLYGRGGADDAYSVFTAITAIKALQEQNIPHGRCVLLIESCEESGSVDLDFYLEEYKAVIGSPDLIICLDSGCGDYQRMWLTTSLRGGIGGRLSVDILSEGIHSGNSGAVASSFRIIRQLLDRIEDAGTGDILVDELKVDVPQNRLDQIREAAGILGEDLLGAYPLVDGAMPAVDDVVQLMIKKTWGATLSYTGVDGMPSIDKAGNVLRPNTTLALAFRTPPTADPFSAGEKIKQILEQDPPYGAKVSFDISKSGNGWEMPRVSPEFEDILEQVCLDCFGNALGYTGEGGGIPLMNLLAQKFPRAEFLVTGVLGPHANAHGPNESLDIPFVKKLTSAIACILAQRC
ncbi:MAG: M20/M25/M40 family metallo-hydrolase [Desulfobacteraceae bacterium]|nr:M20/M25/M40 family metallo-hydrolase [Desulfobacteraceae bacterium]